MTSGCVETTCDAVFVETNDSQKEQVDLDLVDGEEAPYDALQRMDIDDIMAKDPSNQPQCQSPNDTTPPEQGLDHDKHEEEEEEQHDQVQEESNDQGGGEDNGDNREAPPHPTVRHNI
jgi:hypothetical protein